MTPLSSIHVLNPHPTPNLLRRSSNTDLILRSKFQFIKSIIKTHWLYSNTKFIKYRRINNKLLLYQTKQLKSYCEWFSFSWEHKVPLMAGMTVHNSVGCWIDRWYFGEAGEIKFSLKRHHHCRLLPGRKTNQGSSPKMKNIKQSPAVHTRFKLMTCSQCICI